MTRDELVEKFKELHSYPIIQHPDYEQDTAYDIDDILEVINKMELSFL